MSVTAFLAVRPTWLITATLDSADLRLWMPAPLRLFGLSGIAHHRPMMSVAIRRPMVRRRHITGPKLRPGDTDRMTRSD